MHVAGKVLLGLGTVVLVLGILMAFAGGENIKDSNDVFEDWENFVLENKTSGTLSITDLDDSGDWGFTFWVEGEYIDEDGDEIWDHCQTTDITITSAPETNPDWDDGLDGGFFYRIQESYEGCEVDDNNVDYTYRDMGLVKVGKACLACYAGSMEFDSSTSVWIVYDDLVFEELVGGFADAAGGFLAAVGGLGLMVCGGCFMLLGGILALVLRDRKEETQIQQPPSA